MSSVHVWWLELRQNVWLTPFMILVRWRLSFSNHGFFNYDRVDVFIMFFCCLSQPRIYDKTSQLCYRLMISMKFNWHNKRLCWSEGVLQGTCPYLPTTTVLRHLVVPRLSPLQQFLRKVVTKLAQDGRKATT